MHLYWIEQMKILVFLFVMIVACYVLQ